MSKARPAAGYSGTPLVRKLGVKSFMNIVVVQAPEHYWELVGRLPAAVKVGNKLAGRHDLVHYFVRERRDLERDLGALKAAIAPDGALWVSWPKKASRQATDLTEDGVREVALPLQLVDVKVCAIDATWSALKLVVRREARK